MRTANGHADELLKHYAEIQTQPDNMPEWAVHKITKPDELVKCTIPFVGKLYDEQSKRILVYASAENLADYYRGKCPNPWLDDDAQAVNRHRKCFEDAAKNVNPSDPFPHVHLAPMDNGCLTTAVMYIASKLYSIGTTTPSAFCETISFGNYGKYSIETARQKNIRLNGEDTGNGRNNDYPNRPNYLRYSHHFIAADIELLNPDYIILPKSIYNSDRAFIDGHKGKATIIPICQMNATVINGHIAPSRRNMREYKQYKPSELSKSVRMAYSHIRCVNREKYLYVFGYLDEVLNDVLK